MVHDAKDINHYAGLMTNPEPELLARLNRQTHVEVLYPRMLSGHLQGRLLSMMSNLLEPKAILEIGTFTGYGCICLAEGLCEGAKITTIEKDPEREEMIQSYLQEAGLADRVELMLGDAMEIVPTLVGPYDLVFIDADKRNYPHYYQSILPKVRPNGLIIVDNVWWDGKVMESHNIDPQTQGIIELNNLVNQDDRVEQLFLPVWDGITLIRKRK